MGGERGQQGSVVPWPGASAWPPHSTFLPSPWGNRASFPYAGAFHVPSGSWAEPEMGQEQPLPPDAPPPAPHQRPLCSQAQGTPEAPLMCSQLGQEQLRLGSRRAGCHLQY